MRVPQNWGVFLVVCLISVLPAFTDAKIGGLQTEDVVLLELLTFCVARWLCAGFKFRINAKISELSCQYIGLLFVLLCFSVVAFRMQMFPLEDVSVLKTPLLFSVSKFLQVAAVMCGFLWLTNALLDDPARLRQALSLYWVTGVASCICAVGSYVAMAAFHVELRGAYGDGALRARGFFNEGGPFGIYVVSVFVIGLLRRRITGKRLGYVNVAICSMAFLLSRSGAAFFLLVLLFLLHILSAASFRKRVGYLLVATALFWAIAATINLKVVLLGYLNSYQNIEQKMSTMGEIDPNLVMGRIAGAYIVPRMVAAHPITGIGIGNYSLMRNDPHYLGSLPSIRNLEDLSGMGIIGDTAELGIPGTLFLAFLYLAPYRRCKDRSTIIAIAGLYQFLACLMGAHMNFFFPWFVSACAVAANEYQGSVARTKMPITSEDDRRPSSFNSTGLCHIPSP